GLVVVRPGDRVDDLGLVEVLRPVDHGDEADQDPVAHDLRLELRRTVAVPHRLAAVAQVDAHAELVDTRLLHVRVDAPLAQRVHHVPCPVLFHEEHGTSSGGAAAAPYATVNRTYSYLPSIESLAAVALRPPRSTACEPKEIDPIRRLVWTAAPATPST